MEKKHENNKHRKNCEAALLKLPGKLSLNVSFVVPVCPAHDHQDHHDSHSVSLQDM